MRPVPRRHRRADERGASSIEYGLITFAIAAVMVGLWWGFGAAIHDTFSRSSSCIAAEAQSVC